jgi:CheY-like chemotaxis protein
VGNEATYSRDSVTADDATKLGGKGKAIILAVERDPNIRELEAHFLERAGYSVEFRQDGQDALAQARKLVPDIIITEILVPKLDGLALCRQLKADPLTRDIAVLVFSILAAAERAREAGADAFLLKPLAEHRLVETVRQLLDNRSARPRRTQHER